MYTDIILVKQDRLLNTISTMNLRFYCRLRYELFIKISYYLFYVIDLFLYSAHDHASAIFSDFLLFIFSVFEREREREREKERVIFERNRDTT